MYDVFSSYSRSHLSIPQPVEEVVSPAEIDIGLVRSRHKGGATIHQPVKLRQTSYFPLSVVQTAVHDTTTFPLLARSCFHSIGPLPQSIKRDDRHSRSPSLPFASSSWWFFLLVFFSLSVSICRLLLVSRTNTRNAPNYVHILCVFFSGVPVTGM